ncbi:uncharacterized protein LOC5574901 isoform X2 [Aedes aegypti]|uniref:Kazal-like domain-containing protein n=1 Tax=Aedes aegypti TaxID=7159 RepID=A0A6I8TL36_AEDAE|nr:uncharacterized protein LOC5574901 isoform X2 [Aedes aegypti]
MRNRVGAEEYAKLEHSGGRRCCRRFAKLRPVKMSVPSSVAAGLKLDNGINYVKCAAAARNNASIEPIYRLNSQAPVLLENPLERSSISISGPIGDDLVQQVQQKQQRHQEDCSSNPQSRPRGRRRGRRRPKCVWMWRRWFNYSLPSLVSSLLVCIPAKSSIYLSQLRPSQQKRCKSQNSHQPSGRSSVANRVLASAEEKEEIGNPSAVVNGGSDCKSSDYSSCRRGSPGWQRSSRSCHRSSPLLGSIFGGIDVKLVLVIMVLIGVIDYSEAGTCWLRRIESTGKCNKLFTRNVSRENCCNAGTGLGYSDRDITDVQLFFVNAFNDGMDCSSCLDSCEKAKCGVNKRCVMKKGRPKCICAPSCKAPKQAKKLPNQNIKVINLSDSQRNRRQYFSSGPRAAASRMGPPSSSNNKRSVRLLGDEPSSHQHHSRTVKTSLSEKKISQRSSNGKVANSKHKDNLLETVTLGNRRSQGDDGSRKVNHTERLSDRMVLMADGPVQINSYARKSRSEAKPILVTSSSANVRHRNRKVSSNGYNETLEGSHRAHNEQTPSSRSPHHHSRDFGKPRLLRLESSGKDNRTVDARIPRRQPPPHLEEMFYVAQNRRSRVRADDFDFGNEITQHVGVGFYNPVCGTDGKTYKTECQLKKRACRQESTTLVKAYKGHCQTSCRFVQCPDGKHCVEDQNSTPHCVTCAMDCPAADSRSSAKAVVCGTDGNTYRNVCELKRKACLTGRAIPVAYRGRCVETATCDTIKCKDRQQCLTDLQTHKPRCVSCSYKCPRVKRPQQTRSRQNGNGNGNGNQQHRQSQHHQQQPNVKLCGTNNHTYHSWCHMLRDSCNTGFYIDVQYNGVCSFDRSVAPSSILTLSASSSKTKP